MGESAVAEGHDERTIRVDGAFVDRYAAYERAITAHERRSVVNRRKNEDSERHQATKNALLVAAALAVAAGWVAVRIAALRVVYAPQHALYESARFRRGPSPEGAVQFTMNEVALAAEYPPLYGVAVALLGSSPLGQAGAHFLLLMLQEFGPSIQRVHWAGSGSQLGYDDIDLFTQGWEQWNSPRNGFRWLYRTAREYDASLMLHCRRRTGTRSLLGALYGSGLCGVASAISVDKTRTAEGVLAELTSTYTRWYPRCDAQRAFAAAGSVSNALGIGATGVGLFGALGLSLATPLGLGLLGATGAASWVMGKRSYDSTMCAVPEGATRLSSDSYTADARARCEEEDDDGNAE